MSAKVHKNSHVKRRRTFGFRARTKTKSGLNVLKRRRAKGRLSLSA